MTDLTKTKCRLRGYPESEVRGLWRDEDGKLRGWYRINADEEHQPLIWNEGGRVGFTTEHDFDLIPVPETVKSEGFWLAVGADGRVAAFPKEELSDAKVRANVDYYADLKKPQGAIKYFPPMEYEAGAIIEEEE